jgi:hypothetical protein
LRAGEDHSASIPKREVKRIEKPFWEGVLRAGEKIGPSFRLSA